MSNRAQRVTGNHVDSFKRSRALALTVDREVLLPLEDLASEEQSPQVVSLFPSARPGNVYDLKNGIAFVHGNSRYFVSDEILTILGVS
jgi:hypothetical protein